MADRSPIQLYVYACAEGEGPKILDAIHSTTLRLDYGNEVEDDTLTLGSAYGDGEATTDDLEAITDAMLEAAPGATWAAWLDPVYEYPGDLVMYAPDLGIYTGNCDAEGNPTVTTEQMRRIIETTPGCEEALEAIKASLGNPWEERIIQLNKERNAEHDPHPVRPE